MKNALFGAETTLDQALAMPVETLTENCRAAIAANIITEVPASQCMALAWKALSEVAAYKSRELLAE